MIIGITGTTGAGKGTVVEYLVKQKGFTHFSARELIVAEVKKRGLPVNRDTTTPMANELRTKYGTGYIAEELCRRAMLVGGNAVVESLRSIGEIEFLKRQPDAFVIGVDADVRLRYQRVLERKSELDHISFDYFVIQEQREISDDPTKGNLLGCIKIADVVILNNGTKEELFVETELALKQLAK